MLTLKPFVTPVSLANEIPVVLLAPSFFQYIVLPSKLFPCAVKL